MADAVYSRFRDTLAGAVEALQVIDPADAKTLVGPLIDAGSRASALAAVAGACAILGLDPLYVANEGKLLVCVAPEAAEAVLAAMRRHPAGKDAAVIGEVQGDVPGQVLLRTIIGGRRSIEMLAGEQLPRIC